MNWRTSETLRSLLVFAAVVGIAGFMIFLIIAVGQCADFAH